MSTTYFRVDEHTTPCQHIRQYPRSTAHNQNEVLRIAIKQYTPLDNLNPQPGDITIVAAHANGVNKELYEPLWDELLAQSNRTKAFRIRGIWFADVSFQGQSYVLNEGKVGNDPSWNEHARDLLHMINHFRDQMPRPLVGVGHSMGGQNITALSLIHPRLFTNIVLIDPVIQTLSATAFSPAVMSTKRRDVWPSREEAAASFQRNKFYQSWDPRVLDLWIKYGLRDLPTLIHPTYTPPTSQKSKAESLASTAVSAVATASPAPAEKPVTLTTPKHQEVFTFLRAKFPPNRDYNHDEYQPPRKTHPDLIGTAENKSAFYRPESPMTFWQLPHLRPRTFFVFAGDSYLSTAELRKQKLDTTGYGYGGNGGVEGGGVKSVLIDEAGHFVPFEKPAKVAQEITDYLGREMEEWRKDEEEFEKMWAATEMRDKAVMSDDYVYWVTKPPGDNGRPSLSTGSGKSKL